MRAWRARHLEGEHDGAHHGGQTGRIAAGLEDAGGVGRGRGGRRGGGRRDGRADGAGARVGGGAARGGRLAAVEVLADAVGDGGGLDCLLGSALLGNAADDLGGEVVLLLALAGSVGDFAANLGGTSLDARDGASGNVSRGVGGSHGSRSGKNNSSGELHRE